MPQNRLYQESIGFRKFYFLCAWVKVFRINTEFRIFSLLRGHFSKTCKSGVFQKIEVATELCMFTKAARNIINIQHRFD